MLFDYLVTGQVLLANPAAAAVRGPKYSIKKGKTLVLGMNTEGYYPDGKRWWFRLHEKGGKHYEDPAHHTSSSSIASQWPVSVTR